MIRRAARLALTQPWVINLAASWSGGHAAIFLLHRFTDSAEESTGTPTLYLQQQLAWLRRHRYRLTDLGALVDDLHAGRPIPPRTVAFTVDDGHADFHELASPVFAQFDCPVAVFLVTDFIDGKRWLWWDSLEYGFSHTSHTSCRITVNGFLQSFAWDSMTGRRAAAERLVHQVKWLPATERNAVIKQVIDTLEIQLPSRPVGEFAPMTWDQVRALTRSGVNFGPHSVSHPILAMEDAEVALREITESCARVREEVPGSLPIFCYPNGIARAFGEREERMVAGLGLRASLSCIPGYLSTRRFSQGGGEPTIGLLPRFPLEHEHGRFIQVASGVERLKGNFRRK